MKKPNFPSIGDAAPRRFLDEFQNVQEMARPEVRRWKASENNAFSWRISCLILLLVAGFLLASIVQTGAFHSPSHDIFEDLEADRAEAAERGISLQELWVEQEAAARGISVGEVLAEQARARKLALERAKRERAIQAIGGAAALVVIVVLFITRRRLAASISRRWRTKSKAFRAWVFGSISWAVGTALYVWLVEPYGSRMYRADDLHMFSVMFVPPLFLGAVWFGYERFVSLEKKANAVDE